MIQKLMSTGLAIRSFMNKNFPTMVDAMFPISFVVLFISIIYSLSNLPKFIGAGTVILTFFLLLIVGVISIIFIFGIIYVLIDTRDRLKKDGS